MIQNNIQDVSKVLAADRGITQKQARQRWIRAVLCMFLFRLVSNALVMRLVTCQCILMQLAKGLTMLLVKVTAAGQTAELFWEDSLVEVVAGGDTELIFNRWHSPEVCSPVCMYVCMYVCM